MRCQNAQKLRGSLSQYTTSAVLYKQRVFGSIFILIYSLKTQMRGVWTSIFCAISPSKAITCAKRTFLRIIGVPRPQKSPLHTLMPSATATTNATIPCAVNAQLEKTCGCLPILLCPKPIESLKSKTHFLGLPTEHPLGWPAKQASGGTQRPGHRPLCRCDLRRVSKTPTRLQCQCLCLFPMGGQSLPKKTNTVF